MCRVRSAQFSVGRPAHSASCGGSIGLRVVVVLGEGKQEGDQRIQVILV